MRSEPGSFGRTTLEASAVSRTSRGGHGPSVGDAPWWVVGASRRRHDAGRVIALVAVLGTAACGATNDPLPPRDDAGASADGGSEAVDAGDSGAGGCGGGMGVEGADAAWFDGEGLVAPITEEPCTLSSGTATTCLKVQLRGAPSDHPVGPFCPRTIEDTADAAGIWLESGTVYDVDGAFVVGLPALYGDPAWQLYDPATGRVRVTDTQASCSAAARPDVDPAYNNYCVECALEYVGGGVATTLMIPAHPVALAAPREIGRMSVVGTALNGVAFDPPAPVAAILAAHTIAAFDDCGGHVNLAAGYHYHAATGCSREIPSCDGHAALIGVALDGYAIHAMTDERGVEPSDLDACRGHTDAVRGYHYHVAGAGENMFLGCFHGDVVAATGGGGMPPGGGGAMACAPGQTAMCCGDGRCDGPETTTNCSADCG